jgi:DNA replication protein DnaC
VETQRVVVGWRRYDWGVADVQRFEDRLVRVTKALGFEVPAHIESKEVDWDAEEARVQREWREAKAQVLLGRLEPNYREATTNHGLSRKWLQAYDEGRHVNLTITGKTGTGKTWEAAALTRSLLVDRMVPVVFTRVPELLDSLRPDKSGIDIVGYQAAPVLVLDDLGAERATEWTGEQLYRISDYREAHSLPTIITSNLEAGELNARYDERVTRRLFQRSALLVLTDIPKQLPKKFSTQL